MKMVQFQIESIYGNAEMILTDEMFPNLMNDFKKSDPRKGYQFTYCSLKEAKVGEGDPPVRSDYINGVPYVLKDFHIREIIEAYNRDKLATAVQELQGALRYDNFVHLKNETINVDVDFKEIGRELGKDLANSVVKELSREGIDIR